MSDQKKTKRQLIAELESLRRQLASREGDAGEGHDETASEPSLTRPMTRRTALTNWIAPVILSIPVAGAVRPGKAWAQLETAAPTELITPDPATASPTEDPTTSPPTQAPVASPTSSPTQAPIASPTTSPTQAPVAFPTAAPTVAAIPIVGPGGLGVLGGALAVAGAKLLKDRKKPSTDDDSGDEPGDESEGD